MQTASLPRRPAGELAPAILLLTALGTSAFFINDATLCYLFASLSLVGLGTAVGLVTGALHRPQLPRFVWAAPLAALTLYAWSICRSPAVNASLLEAYALMAVPAALLIGLCASDALWSRLLPGTLMLGSLFCAAGAAEKFFLGGLAHGPFADTNSFAAVANVVMLAAVTTWFDKRHPVRLRALARLTVAAALAGAMAAVSRGGWLSLVMAACLGAAVWRPQVRYRKAVAGAIALLVVAGLLSVAPRLLQAGQTGHDRSVTSRLAQLISAQEVLKDYPDGVGLGLWSRVYPRYRLEADDDSAGFHLHNDYLEILVETGSAGLVAMLVPGLLALAVLRRARYPQSSENPERPVALGYALAFLVIAIHAVVNFIFHDLVLSLAGGLFLGRAARLAWSRQEGARATIPQAVAAALAALVLCGWMLLSYVCHISLDVVSDPYGSMGRRLSGLANPEVLAKLERLHPFEARVPLARGMLYVAQAITPSALTREERVKKFHQAFPSLEAARQRDPVDAGILYQMALAHYYFHEPLEGDRLLVKSLALQPTRAASVVLYVKLRIVSHDFAAARQVLDNAIVRSPESRKAGFLPLRKVIDDAQAAWFNRPR